MCSAANPEALRGPEFDAAWSDELGKWRRCKEAWTMLQFCLRLGDRPRQIVTTTPRGDNPLLLRLVEAAGSVVTRAPSASNRAHLAEGFIERLTASWGGSSMARQELEGEFVTERVGALWTRATIEAARVREAPELDRVVVAVDPPVTSGPDADECGIVVAGRAGGADAAKAHVYVLADESVGGAGPTAWADRALDAYRAFAADRLVAEVNQGGEMVESVIRNRDPFVSYSGLRATRGKTVRAEPVAALYEQGRVHHVGAFPELEDQMCSFVQGRGMRSPDRMDALVWAVTSLMLDGKDRDPRVRRL